MTEPEAITGRSTRRPSAMIALLLTPPACGWLVGASIPKYGLSETPKARWWVLVMSSLSPMQRSLAKLRQDGYRVHITEHYSRGLKHDLFGFCDILALRENEVLAVQVTSGSNVAARVKKIMDSEELPFVRKAAIRVVVHGWKKYVKTGWTCREVDLS